MSESHLAPLPVELAGSFFSVAFGTSSDDFTVDWRFDCVDLVELWALDWAALDDMLVDILVDIILDDFVLLLLLEVQALVESLLSQLLVPRVVPVDPVSDVVPDDVIVLLVIVDMDDESLLEPEEVDMGVMVDMDDDVVSSRSPSSVEFS